MALVPLGDRPSLVETVHDRLIEAICNGELAPGEALVQERLAQRLGVSRQPIIQALAMLRRDGFVEAAGKRGYRVAPMTPELVAQVYEVRGALDRLAAGAAASPRAVDAGPRLERALAEGEAAHRGGDMATMVDADVRFHRTVYALSGNPLIEETATGLWRHVRRAMALVLRDGDRRERVWAEHRAIAEAILAGDKGRAADAAGAHAERAAAELAARLEDHAA